MSVHPPPPSDLAAIAVVGRRHVRPRLVPPTHGLCAPETPEASSERHNGSPGDILLQGFHARSHEAQNPSWRTIVAQNAEVIRAARFDLVWLPPSSASADPLGYLPTRWTSFDNAYGARAELEAAIRALHPVRSVADVVVNHRCGVASGGVDFADPAFADPNRAVCQDDECGIGTGALDTGENQPAARDLDHTNPEVQAAVIAYLRDLKALGFSGWRFDEAKGYGGQFTRRYNDASAPYLAVGEYWSGDRQALMNWIDATGGLSMAFDFPTRALLKDAIARDHFGPLKTVDGKPAGALGWWPAMSVTFLDNHDTEVADPFGDGDELLRGYAYPLTHPGIPSIYWPHFFDFGAELRGKLTTLMSARKDTGIGRDSVVNIVAAEAGLYAALIGDETGMLALKLGSRAWSPGDGFTLVTDGNDVAVWRR